MKKTILEPAHVRVLNLIVTQPDMPARRDETGRGRFPTINYAYLTQKTHWLEPTLINLLHEARQILGCDSTYELVMEWRARCRK